MNSDDFPPEPVPHTPGPWYYDPSEYGRTIWADRHGDVVSPTICDVLDTTEGLEGDDPESDANGRLIAAAPDLLKHLREICDEIEMHSLMAANPVSSGYAPSDGDLVDALRRMMFEANKVVNAALGIEG